MQIFRFSGLSLVFPRREFPVSIYRIYGDFINGSPDEKGRAECGKMTESTLFYFLRADPDFQLPAYEWVDLNTFNFFSLSLT